MDLDFWHERWETGQTGFHQSDFNPYLLKHWPDLKIATGDTVFVPLAGKSNDVFWLAQQGYRVIGIELSPIAVKEFFASNQLEPTVVESGNFTIYQSPNIDFYCGDYFSLSADQLTEISAVFDRASLIAMPPTMRQQYAAQMQKIVPAGTQSLLISMEYPQHEMDGPPFSVSEEEVRSLYQQNFDVEVLDEIDVLADNERFKQRGITAMCEKIYRLKKKS